MKRFFTAFFGFVLFLPVMAADIPVYTGASEGSLVIGTGETWYLEECDGLSRPVSGTLWKNGEIEERTSWIYELDSQNPSVKIVTGSATMTETLYDAAFNITMVTVTDSKGVAVSTLQNSFTADNLLSGSTFTEGSKTTVIEYEYGDDKKLQQKKRYENGELAVVYRYESDDNWTETVYSKSVPVLTARYEDGTRVKDGDEKKE